MATCIEMIAHCIYHQTPPRERASCAGCGAELRLVEEAWYCPHCLRQASVEDCPICTGRAWH